MAYEPSKDKELWIKRVESGDFYFDIKVMQYDDGDKKLQINKYKVEDGYPDKWQKVGRYTKQELEILLPAIKEAMEKM